MSQPLFLEINWGKHLRASKTHSLKFKNHYSLNTDMEVNFFIAFASGIVVGATPCIILILSVFGSSLALLEGRRKFMEICTGLLLGFISTYIAISILFIYFVGILDMFLYFRYIFAAILIGIGIWQIIESKKEDSTIFGTPQKVKGLLKRFIDKNSGVFAFLVGIIFIKKRAHHRLISFQY